MQYVFLFSVMDYGQSQLQNPALLAPLICCATLALNFLSTSKQIVKYSAYVTNYIKSVI